jgi:predicted transcriptional regulator
MAEQLGSDQLVSIAADIVSAYVSNNPVPSSDLPTLIGSIHKSLSALAMGEEPASAEPLKPAVSVKKSVQDDYLICLDDGKKFKSLKRHIGVLGMTPDEYRAKWSLPADYPMVAPAYAAARSSLAKKFGLGRKPKEQAPVAKRGRAKVVA